MEAKVIDKKIRISAPVEKVWDVLVTDELNRVWYAEFSPGAYAETDWREGSQVSFLDDSKNGITGTLVSCKPNEIISIVYDGVVEGGVNDFECQMANDVKGGREIYMLSQVDGATELHVICDMSDMMYDMMASAWDRGLAKIKELAEKQLQLQ
ncbi:MAG TPA: SRPBCC domain-containing protein [Flavobacterium sp.]|jgi:uncharacterized protein YndB with AHSA1/START domain